MKQLVQEAIQALTYLDAERLDKLLGELTIYQISPPSHAELREALPGQRVLGALLRETERNLRLLQRSSPCGTSRIAMGTEVYSAAWRSEQ
ncbi:MAG TPA: hypothetical protein VHX63_02780 [Acidobacteriaceae bacterium]|jgi:hypothetical protein|nr:hypothetical protein [Acidobacteriaceae bacterium]